MAVFTTKVRCGWIMNSQMFLVRMLKYVTSLKEVQHVIMFTALSFTVI